MKLYNIPFELERMYFNMDIMSVASTVGWKYVHNRDYHGCIVEQLVGEYLEQ